ncbi:MAG: transposase [Kosmotogaceae bacterium]
MGLGKRKKNNQDDMFLTYKDLPKSKGHPFYKKVNKILSEWQFDEQVEELAKPYYHEKLGRQSIPPGVYLRMLFIGFFEGIESEREIAWRCVDSLSLRQFLGYRLTEDTPDHSTLSKTRQRLPIEFHREGFTIILELLAKYGLVKGNVIGLDASMMEANASMKSLVRKETKEDYNTFLEKLAKEAGIETPTKDQQKLVSIKTLFCSNYNFPL